MEGFMHSRCLIIAATALAFAGSATAEPAKPAAKPAAERPAEVVLASADQDRPPAVVVQAQAAPAKKRAARVTTCRCAGQTPQNDQ
jgi:hypothetical protein